MDGNNSSTVGAVRCGGRPCSNKRKNKKMTAKAPITPPTENNVKPPNNVMYFNTPVT